MTRVDLHVHTALSACCEDVMSPRLILERAAAHGLNLVALTDHNATANLAVALEIAEEFPALRVIPGMELTTREEVHLLALFETLDAALDLQRLVDENLPGLPNNPDFFGYQLVYDRAGEIVDVDERLRQLGCNLALDAAVKAIHERGGYAVPAHVLRKKYSLTSQLGFIDPDAEFDAVEIRWRDWVRGGHRVGDRLEGHALITGSDAHFLEDVGRCTMQFDADVASLSELFDEL